MYKKIFNVVMIVLLICMSIITLKPAAETVFNKNAITTNSTSKKLPIYCVQTEEKKVAISFDAAWGADDTDDLLKILKDNDVKATFFLVADWVKKFPNDVKKIAESGHDIANHSSTHPHMAQLTKEQVIKEIKDTHDIVKELLGIDMNLFRPPFGEYNNTVIEGASECDYYTIQWDVDILDTKIEVAKVL